MEKNIIYSYNFEYKIESGDSLVKYKGNTFFKLIKRQSREIVIFKD